jgi:hypothetical protein
MDNSNAFFGSAGYPAATVVRWWEKHWHEGC